METVIETKIGNQQVDGILGEVKKESKGIIFGDELLDMDIPEQKWIVDKIIPCGGISLIVAPPKFMKSFLALDICCSLANGKDFLGLKTIKSKVLYIDEENGCPELKRRLSKLTLPKDITKEEIHNIGFLIYKNVKINSQIAKKLEEVILKEHIEVVIIDSLVRVLEGDENDAKDMKVLFDCLKGLIEKYNVTFIILHHTRKSMGKKNAEDSRGSGDLIAQCSSMLMINQLGKDYALELICIRVGSNDIPSIKFKIKDITLPDGHEGIEIENLGNSNVLKHNIYANEAAAEDIIIWLQSFSIGHTFKTGNVKKHFNNKHKDNAITSALNEILIEKKIIKENGCGKWEKII